MADELVRVDIDADLLSIVDVYTAEARSILDDIGLELADELQRNSPVGATELLKQSWDVIGSTRRRNTLDLRFAVVNTAPNSLNRVVGRGPGKLPPFGDGSEIDQWVEKVQGVSDEKERKSRRYLVARSIAQRGTQRWRDKENILGLDPQTGTYQADSPVLRKKEEAIARIEAITIPRKLRKGRR